MVSKSNKLGFCSKKIRALMWLLSFVLFVMFFMYKIADFSNLVLHVDQGVEIESVYLNGELVAKGDQMALDGGNYFFEINPRGDNNLLVVSVLKDEAKRVGQHSCKIAKKGRNCFSEAWVTEKSILCSHCEPD